MHSRIFQLSEKRIPKSEYIGVNVMSPEDYGSFHVDYIDESESRSEDISWLADVLPQSMFSVNGNAITIVGNGDEFLADSLAKIKDMVNSMKPEDLLTIKNYTLTRMLDRLGDILFLFYFPEWSGMCAFNDIIDYARRNVGKKLYVGGTLDYHF